MTVIRQVNGFRLKDDALKPIFIDVRVTVDERGKTLSLCDSEVLLAVPVEPLAGMVDVSEGRGAHV